jgi:hypothetical protein
MIDFEIQPPTCESYVTNFLHVFPKDINCRVLTNDMYYSLVFIARISTPTLDGPSLSYMMFPNSCNTLLCNVGSFILIHAYFCHVFFICHKHKNMTMFSHIVLQERKCKLYMKLGGFKYNQC